MSETAKQVPLIELLRSVPRDARHLEEVGNPDFPDCRSYPVGRLCHEAADRIDQLEKELAESQQIYDKVNAGLRKMFNGDLADHITNLKKIAELEEKLAEARKDAESARAHLAWIAKNIQRPCYRHICDRNGIAEDALAILKRKRSPDDDELFALSEIDKAMETP